VFAGVRAIENQKAVRAGQLHAEVVAEPTGGGPVQRDAHRRGSRRRGCARTGRGRRPAGHRHGNGHAVQGL